MRASRVLKKAAIFGFVVALSGGGAFAQKNGLGGGGGYSGSARAGGGPIPGIARAYVIRLQEQVKQADAAAIRGSQLMADGDYEGAIDQYRAALDLLPDAQVTAQRRTAYVKQFSRAATQLARQYADAARYNEAMGLIEEVLRPTISPDNIEAKRLLEQLNDPEYYSPALSPAHLERVRKVKMALKTGQGYLDYGDYDRAEREYHKALNIDRYNSAARRSLEDVERHRLNYYEVARDHTRAAFLREIASEWEMPVPSSITTPEIDDVRGGTTAQIQINQDKLKNIRLPSVEFAETPLKDALEFLQNKSVELDFKEADPTKKGINIILQAGDGSSAPVAPPAGGGAPPGGGGFGFEGGGGGVPGGGIPGGGGGIANFPVTLRLSNVPLGEALRYTTSLAQLKYKVESYAVLVVPLSTPDADLHTNTYTVPPTFLISGGQGGGGPAPVADPFAPPDAGGGGGAIQGKLSAREVLEKAGITFGQGATAIYNPTTSILIVKNTPDQMDLVEAYIDSIKINVEKQVFITSKFVEISEEVGKELGFDWMLGAFNLGSTPRVFANGGTSGQLPGAAQGIDFGQLNPGGSIVGTHPVTAALRSGTRAIDTNSIDALIATAAGQQTGINQPAPAVFGISGVFTDPQFQVMIRALNQKKGVDLLSAPSVMARPGERAKIEVIREFIYPTEYDPPEIPTNFGGNAVLNAVPGAVQTQGGFPVTPANPTAFEVRNTGVTLEVDPVLGPDNFTIDLNLAPEVVEFDGFINYGSPITTTAVDGLGQIQNVVITPNRIEMPVFNTRRVTTRATVWDGQTVAIGGLIREDIQDIEDKIPFVGDLPVIGRFFRNNVELHLKRNLTIFVTAEIQDPSGRRIHSTLDDDEPNYIQPRPKVAPPATFTAPPPLEYIK